MNKVEEAILSEKNSPETCMNFIQAISNVPGDSNCSLIFMETVQKLWHPRQDLHKSILIALLRMTIKVPLLFEPVFDFIERNVTNTFQKMESFAILSRAYRFDK